MTVGTEQTRMSSGRDAMSNNQQLFGRHSISPSIVIIACLAMILCVGCARDLEVEETVETSVDEDVELTDGGHEDISDIDDGQTTEPAAVGSPPMLTPLERLAQQRSRLEQRQTKMQALVRDTHVKLAQLTSDVTTAMRRSGKTTDEILTLFKGHPPKSGPLAELYLTYQERAKLAAQLRQLEAVQNNEKLLIQRLQKNYNELERNQQFEQFITPESQGEMDSLLAEVEETLDADAILDTPIAAADLDSELQILDSEIRSRAALVPARTETELSDLPSLPRLEFESESVPHQVLLDSLKSRIQQGKTAATASLKKDQVEAAIEALHETLQAVVAEMEAFRNPPPWKDDLLEQVAEVEKKLADALASPYLGALNKETLTAAYRDQQWSLILDVLEELIRLAPKHPDLSSKVRQIDELLYAKEQLGDVEAEVARQRFEEIRRMMNIPRSDAATLHRATGKVPTAADIEFVPISPGTFQMGSDVRSYSDEKPVHQVTISKPFFAGKYEVTVGQILKWLNTPGVNFNDEWIDLDSSYCPIKKSGSRFVLNTDAKYDLGNSVDQPMVEISWHGAKAFCEWCSGQDSRFTYRLPTEAEWEYMARAGTTTAFAWGDSLNGTEANVDGNHPYGTSTKGPMLGKTTKVGAYPPNGWGLYDTVGNVWEWCVDTYDKDFYSTSAARQPDPVNRSSGSSRVLRGGSWDFYAIDARSARRGSLTPDHRNFSFGFRVVAE